MLKTRKRSELFMNKSLDKISAIAQKSYNLRVSVAQATTAAESGHPSSCFSAADILAVLFFHVLKFDIRNPKNNNNDRFILSKGHAAPLLYAVYHELGVISHEQLLQMRDISSVLEGHPTPRFEWVDVATGSLGVGLSVGVGMALHARRCKKTFYTYVLLGDSELAEGSNWEAFALGAFYKLDNLIAIVDINRLGQRGPTIDEYNIDILSKKISAFGWQVYCVDGHDISELTKTFDYVRTKYTGGPVVILAKTIKGYGVARIEDKNGFHGKAFTKAELPAVLTELKQRFYDPDFKQEKLNFVSVSSNKKIGILPVSCVPKSVYKIGEQVLVRQAFGDALCQAGELLDNLICLDAEVSNSTYTDIFLKQFPERFIECFVAEQAMVGIAQGLAALGDCALVATFGAFLTRAHDQLRMAAISRLPLRVVGTHAGIEVGKDGPSQMGLEDIALFRSLPNSLVLSPCDAVSCQKLLLNMLNYGDGISYLRLMRGVMPVFYDQNTLFNIGDFNVLKSSDRDRAIIIATGATVHQALLACELLSKHGISVAVLDIYCIKPLNTQKMREFIKKTADIVVSVEDHYADGGLGDVVSVALIGLPLTFKKLAVYELPHSGTSEQLYARAGLDAQSIAKTILALVVR